MRIQHNIMAMNAYRNLSFNNNALSGNLEKLSSGYKINRAGDDAAGLAISEKMRMQITGLDVAQDNAQSGINLVQTAEGALTEVHDMLNRMYELAEKSANGTIDDTVDRKALTEELTELKNEINRINDTADFNGLKLFAGNATTEELNTATPIASFNGNNEAKLVASKTGFTFAAGASDELKDAFNKALGSAGGLIGVTINANSTNLASGDTIKFSNLPGVAAAANAAFAAAGDTEFKYSIVAEDGSTVINVTNDASIAFGSGSDAIALGSTVSIQVTDAEGNAVGTLTIGLPGSGSAVNGTKTTNISLKAGGTDSGDGDGNTQQVTSGITAVASLGTNPGFDSITFTKDSGLTAASKMDAFLEAVGSEGITFVFASLANTGAAGASGTIATSTTLKLDGIPEGYKLEYTGGSVQSLTGTNATIAFGTQASQGELDTTATSVTFTIKTDAGTTIGTIKLDFKAAGSVGEGTATLKFGAEKSPAASETVAMANVTATPASAVAGSDDGSEFTFQIGPDWEDANKITVTIKSISTDKLGLGTGSVSLNDISIDTQSNALDALKVIEQAINDVSTIRGRLGATQNRLEHTINNLAVMEENIQEAESTIRDTDVADEMMEYTKNNILIQSAQAMLAQANQAPQGVLQLLG